MGRRGYSGFTMYESDKAKLNAAFVCFRKLGLVSRQNYYCCGGCAGAAIADDLGTKFTKLWDTKGPVAAKRAFDSCKGCVFYTQQDRGNLARSGKLWLSYGPVCSSEAGDVGMSDVEVGNMIVEVLEALCIRYEWDGKGETRIMVDFRDQQKIKRDEEQQARWAQYDADEKLRLVTGGTATADE